MWPPSSEDSLLACSTVAIAFQRMSERSLCSSSGSPGCWASACTGIVLTYGVLRSSAGCSPRRRASAKTCSSSSRARSGASWRMAASRASTHSAVSAGSTSPPPSAAWWLTCSTAMSGLLEELGVGALDVGQVGQDHAQVVAQGALGALRVVVGDGRDHLVVLVDHLLAVAGGREGQPSHAVELPAGPLADAPRDLAAGEVADRAVQRLVEAIEGLGVAGPHGALLLGQVGLQADEVGGLGQLGRDADGVALQRLADEVRVGDGVRADERDERAQLRDDRHQAV